MPQVMYRYELDKTGINPSNSVVGEVHTLEPAQQYRVLIPTYAPFFTQALTIRDNLTNNLLTRGVDYKIVELAQEPSMLFGKEICNVILISNQNVSNEVRIDYQVLGGYYINHKANLELMYDALINDQRPVEFENVLHRPFQYNPTAHTNYLEDLYGFENVVYALEKIERALTVSNLPIFDELISFINSRFISSQAAGSLIDNKVISAKSEIDSKVNQIILLLNNAQSNYTNHTTIHIQLLRDVVDQFSSTLNSRKEQELVQRDLHIQSSLDLLNQTLAIKNEFATWLNSKLRDRLPFATDEQIENDTAQGLVLTYDQIAQLIRDSGVNQQTASISVSSTPIEEGNSLAVVVNTVNVPDNTVYVWEVVNQTTHDNDFAVKSGNINILNNTATFNISVLEDNLAEPHQTFIVRVRRYSSTGRIMAISPELTIIDINYYGVSFLSPQTTVNEGDTVTFNLTANNIPDNTTYTWNVTGNTSVSNYTGGNITFNANVASFVLPLKYNYVTDPDKHFAIEIRRADNRVLTSTPLITLNDVYFEEPVIEDTYYNRGCYVDVSSADGMYITRDSLLSGKYLLQLDTVHVTNADKNPYSVSLQTPESIPESSTVDVPVTTVNAPNGTVYHWEAVGSGLTSTNGNITINNNAANISLTTVTNFTTDADKLFSIIVRDSLGRIVYQSATVTVTDVYTPLPLIEDTYYNRGCYVDVSSADGMYITRRSSPKGNRLLQLDTVHVTNADKNPYSVSLQTPESIPESSTVDVPVTTVNAPNGTVYHWEAVGSGLTSTNGNITINNNAANISLTTVTNFTTDADKLFSIIVRDSLGRIVYQSATVTVTDVYTPLPLIEDTYYNRGCYVDVSSADGMYITRDSLLSGKYLLQLDTVHVTNADKNPYSVSLQTPESIPESSTVDVPVTTVNAPNGTVYHWEAVGSGLATTNGSITINNNAANISLTTVTNFTTDADKLFSIIVRDSLGRIVYQSATVTVTDVYTPVPIDTSLEDAYLQCCIKPEITSVEEYFFAHSRL